MASRDITAVDYEEVKGPFAVLKEGVDEYVAEINNCSRAIQAINESNPGSEVILNKVLDQLMNCYQAVKDCPAIVAEFESTLRKKSEELEEANAEAVRRLEDIM